MTQELPEFDVVICGAGVGGMALAMQLARRDYRVALVEPEPPPRFRVGESLDWEAPLFLRRLGICVHRLVAEGKATYKAGAVCTAVTQPGVEARFGFAPIFRLLMGMVGRGYPTIHANREYLDVELFEQAKRAGVEPILDRVRTLEREGQRVQRIILSSGRQITARFYADATGRAALFRRAFQIGQTTIGPRKIAVRGRFAHSYDGFGTRIRTDDTLTEPSWIWDINVSHSTTDIGVVLTETDFAALHRKLGSARDVFLHQIRKHEDLREWLEPLMTADTALWSCAFQDLVAEQSAGPNWIAVGESAFVIDAILSSGFTMSLRTGFAAADIIHRALKHQRKTLCPRQCRIYHEKTAAQVRSVNRLIDVLWYNGRLRERYSLMFNVAAILAVNFNFNHLHTRFQPRGELQLQLLSGLHQAIDRCVPWLQKTLMMMTR